MEEHSEIIKNYDGEYIEIIEIITKDGRKVYLVENYRDIYDGDNVWLGRLLEVNSDGSILYDEMQYIIETDYNYIYNYRRCAISDKLFRLNKDTLPILVGKVEKQQDGTYETILSKIK